MASRKGKEIASGKGKRVATETDNNNNINKKKRSISNGAVRFFEDSAHEVHHDHDDDDDDDVSTGFSDFGDDWDFEDDFEAQPSKVNNDGGKSHNVPVFPKEEELSESELEKMAEERYRPGSSYVTYADGRLRNRRTAVDGNEGLPSYKEPTVWKVKCMIGREKQSVFCLMQKFVELNSLGNKLSIISAIFIEHIKGYIYVEAERQSDINEACKGVSTIYSSRLAVVPKNEVSSSLSVQNKCNEVSIGSWARVKNGKYRGDLAQVIAVNDSRKKATVKLIPRIDLQVLAEKYGGGVSSKKATIPAPKLVTSTELEEFRPLIQHRRDRESGLAFDVLDGMMLKDGYLYKKVLMDSLNLYGVIPSQEELLKFESSKNEVPDCHEWLTELYGEKKKEPKVVKNDKGGGGKGDGGKGEGSSSSSAENSFDVSDLVLFNKKDFGVIVGLEKEEYYKVLKEGSEGALVMTVDVRQLKKASFENRFTALDKHKKIISINDNVRVLEGPLEGRQGNVKHVYRGIIFSHDEIEQENNGYFCCKSHICEKVKSSNVASKGKDGESSFPSFDDPPSSPVATEKPWETRRNSSFNSEDQEGFTVGQSLRIRVGPLKGYLCRVLAVRRTGVTVKLDSQHKILTVKTEHLAEVRGRSSAIPMSDDKDAKPFDLLGNSGGSSDWMTGAGTSTDGGSSWPAFPSSGPSAMEIDEKDEGGGGWGSKPASKPSAGWGNTSTDEKPVADSAQAGGWGKPPKTPSEDQAGSSQGAGDWGTGGGNWGQPPKTPSEDQASSLQGAGGWGNKPKNPTDDHGGSSEGTGGSWGSKPITAPINDANSTWGSKPNTVSSNDASSTWGKIDDNACNENSAASGGASWGKSINPAEKVSEESIGGWGNNVVKPTTQTATWGKPPNTDGGQIENRRNDASPDWGKTSNVDEGQGGSWVKNEKKDGGAPAWGKKVESSDGSQGGSWGKNEKKDDGGAPVWGQKVESSVANQGGSWGKNEKKDDGGAPAWGKKIESSNAGQGGSWGKTEKKDDGGAPAWGKKVESSDAGQGGSWGKNDSKKDDSVPAWGKKVESSDAGQGEIWGKSDGKKADSVPAWGSAVESSGGGESGSWGEHTAKKNESSSAWGKIVESSDGCESGSWGKSIAKNSSAPAWGKNVESSDKGSENSSWGKPPPPKSWGNKEDDTGEKKAAWGSGGGSSWGNKQNDGGNSEGGYGGGGDFGGRRGGRGGWRGGRGGRSFGDNDQGERGGSGGGGRWSDQGGERGERGGYRGRGRSNYGSDGGFGGGRGRGRRDDNSDGGGQSWSSAGGGGGSGWGSNGSGGGSGWGASKESNEGQPSILGKPKGADIGDGAQSSGWGASNDKGGSNGQWGKPPGGSSSWGKGDSDGGNKGGW